MNKKRFKNSLNKLYNSLPSKIVYVQFIKNANDILFPQLALLFICESCVVVRGR